MKGVFKGLLVGTLILLATVVAYKADESMQRSITAETVMLDTVPMGTPQSVVLVEVKDVGHGTGFYIGDRKIVTAGHVAAMAGVGKRLTIRFQEAEKTFETSAVVLWIDTERDVALLQSDTLDEMMKAQGMASAKMACELPDASVGTSIVAIGYPMSLGLRYSWGHVASVGTMKLPLTSDPSGNTYLGVDISIAPGNSGGPVFDRHGNVVGLADAFLKFNTEALLIPRSSICASINSTHPVPQAPAAS